MKTIDPAFDWRNDASNDNKRAVVTQRFGGETPDFLWYELGNDQQVNLGMFREATVHMFGVEGMKAGDVELHGSTTQGIGRCLCVRHTTHWASRITVGGRHCYLYAIGHEKDKRGFNFADQWTRARFRPGTRVTVPEGIRGFSVGVTSTDTECRILPKGTFTVVETRFDSPMYQVFGLLDLLQRDAVLANAIMVTAANKNGVWNIPATDLEVVILEDDDRDQFQMCATMLQEA